VGYIFAPQIDTGVTALLSDAQWDATVGAWLIGFSLYIWDSALQSYTISSIPFLSLEPFPVSNYNPLDL